MENFSTVKDLKQVNTAWLPSKGVNYPANIEIYVAPLSVRDRKLLTGATTANYYRTLLDGITIKGGPFNKEDLLFHDVGFIDIARRLYTFSTDEQITIKNYPCMNCKKENVSASFKFEDLEYEDFPEDIFHCTVTEVLPETGEEVKNEYAGKVYTFSDGLQAIVSPLTVGEYIEMATVNLSNISEEDVQDNYNKYYVEMYMTQFEYLIKHFVGREFKDAESRRNFTKLYLADLYREADAELLDDIEKDTNVAIKPFKVKCPDCKKVTEVYVHPSLRFQHALPSVSSAN